MDMIDDFKAYVEERQDDPKFKIDLPKEYPPFTNLNPHQAGTISGITK